MSHQTLLEYLTKDAPPALSYQNTTRTSNTTNNKYSWRDIKNVVPWPDFSYSRIIQDYGPVLNRTSILSDPMPTSPPRPIRDESLFHDRFVEYISPRVRRALRAGFEQNPSLTAAANHEAVTFDGGSAVTLLDQFKPDTAILRSSDIVGTGDNRAPGDLKVSWKWKSEWRTTTDAQDAREYKQVLSQLNYYMVQNKTKYGFIVTDTELVPMTGNCDWKLS
ncbi:hypothetical protein CFD26_101972 [Aspergillus turcosus]|uniref:Fungal-type protein kinase domain-containing protein n=1 Tax=Aspergillus turcosus TaxID=1245748 RepID=A0A3R7IZJ5_9EURO|nr:hypothetical protein CFD26_101972 [Aspergillus turcosus]